MTMMVPTDWLYTLVSECWIPDPPHPRMQICSWYSLLFYLCIVVSKSWIIKKCKKIFYHLFNSVKYLYLPSDTFRKHVERHVTYRKLAFKFTGYCRQSSYTDSAVVFTLLPAVAWDLKSQFPAGYMHFNICFKGVSGKIGIFHNEKLPIEVFWFFCLSRSWQWAGANANTAHTYKSPTILHIWII